MHQRKPWRTTCWGARHFATAVILSDLMNFAQNFLGQKYVILDLKRFFAYWWHVYLQCRFKTIEKFPVFISNWAPNILLDRNSRTKKIFCPVYGLAYMKGLVKITAVDSGEIQIWQLMESKLSCKIHFYGFLPRFISSLSRLFTYRYQVNAAISFHFLAW